MFLVNFYSLLYRIVLVSALQQSESAIFLHISFFFFWFVFHLDYHRALSRVPCATQ